MSPDTFGSFELGSRAELPGGGFDALARDLDHDRDVRLWAGAPGSGDAPEKAANLEETRGRVTKVYHATLPKYLGTRVVDGRACFLVEPYEGTGLASRLARGPLETLEALDVAQAVGAGLAKAHKKELVHGRLGPESVLLREGAGPLLLHFGLAPFLAPAPPLAPEEKTGEAPAEAGDVYRLALLLLTALGEAALPDRAMEPGDLSPELPEGLRRFVARSLAGNPAERIRRAEEFAGDLRVIRASWPSLLAARRPARTVPFPPLPSRGKLAGLGLGALGALVLLVLLRACQA